MLIWLVIVAVIAWLWWDMRDLREIKRNGGDVGIYLEEEYKAVKAGIKERKKTGTWSIANLFKSDTRAEDARKIAKANMEKRLKEQEDE